MINWHVHLSASDRTCALHVANHNSLISHLNLNKLAAVSVRERERQREEEKMEEKREGEGRKEGRKRQKLREEIAR